METPLTEMTDADLDKTERYCTIQLEVLDASMERVRRQIAYEVRMKDAILKERARRAKPVDTPAAKVRS